MAFDLASAKPATGFDLSSAKPVEADKPKSSKSYKEGRGAEGWQRGLSSVMQGPLMGFADEVGGAVGGAWDTLTKGGDYSTNYASNRDFIRGAADQEAQDRPVISTVLQTAASAPMLVRNILAPAVAPVVRSVPVLNNIAQGTGIAARAAQAAGTGATYGAVQGAGNSTADTAAGVAADSGTNALLSSVFGGVGVPVAGAVGAVAGNVRQRVSNSPAAQAAAERYAQWKIAQALARDGQDVGRTGARLNVLGQEARVVDAGGANTRQLLDTLATIPGETKHGVEQAIHQRQAGRGARMIASAEENLNAQGQRLAPTIEAWTEQRSQAAAPLYEQLRTINIQQPSNGLASAVAAADELGATSLARRMATAEQVGYSLDSKNPASWSMNDLDLVKRGLDKMIAAETDIAGKVSSLGRSYQTLKTTLVNELDHATTDPATGRSVYKAARDAFAGPSAIIDAAQRGRTAIASDGATIAGMTSGLSESERQAFRLGAFEALRNKLGTQGGQTNIINMWKEPATQEKLKAIFGDERSFRQFAADVAREGRLKGLDGIGRGSQTASRQFGVGDLDSGAATDAASLVANTKGGNLVGAYGAAKNLWNKVSTPESVRNQMGRILLSGGNEGATNINALAQVLAEIEGRNAAIATGSGLIGSQLARPISTR
jgi:hypothetical protein